MVKLKGSVFYKEGLKTAFFRTNSLGYCIIQSLTPDAAFSQQTKWPGIKIRRFNTDVLEAIAMLFTSNQKGMFWGLYGFTDVHYALETALFTLLVHKAAQTSVLERGRNRKVCSVGMLFFCKVVERGDQSNTTQQRYGNDDGLTLPLGTPAHTFCFQIQAEISVPGAWEYVIDPCWVCSTGPEGTHCTVPTVETFRARSSCFLWKWKANLLYGYGALHSIHFWRN